MILNGEFARNPKYNQPHNPSQEENFRKQRLSGMSLKNSAEVNGRILPLPHSTEQLNVKLIVTGNNEVQLPFRPTPAYTHRSLPLFLNFET
jgi:hypothetical protein